jgi:hypothetical protein
MTMQRNDPRGDYSARATNPETGLTMLGGVLEVVVIVSVASPRCWSPPFGL